MLLLPSLSAGECAGPLLHYTRFHGMLCGPAAAARCVKSFDGTIIFMPSNYDAEAFSQAAAAQRPLPYEVRSLTLLKYYLLVLTSFTGLCSLLRQTRTVDAREGEALDDSGCSPSLAVDRRVVEALAARSGAGAGVRLVRRFEFHFRLIGLRVGKSTGYPDMLVRV